MSRTRSKVNFVKNFPFDSIRCKQEEVLGKLQDNWDNYKYYVLELPTGFGKSPVAQAIGMSVDNSFLLTVTKQLQDQYVRDFHEPDTVMLKGKANYPCNIRPELNVECGPCRFDTDLLKECKNKRRCSYYTQRDKALGSKQAVLSIPFFLYSTTCGGYWKPRDVIIVDECHLLESQIVNWATTIISPEELKKDYDIEIDEYIPQSGYSANRKWLHSIWDIVVDKRTEYEEELKELLDGRDPNDLTEDELQEVSVSHGAYYKIDKIYKRLETFFKSPNKDSWLCEPEGDGVILTPVEVQDLFHRYIKKMVGPKGKIIFMSATILDMVGFSKALGLKKEDTALIKVDSEFPPEKSPIVYKPSGSMNFANIDKSIPKIIEQIEKILKDHPNEKAVIHTGNYKIAEAICEGIKDKRLLMRREGENNEKLLQRHINSKEPTVLVSPSLTTGTDLKDELSRFQIIVKLPFLSLADQRVKKKMEINGDWYVSEMFRTFVQAAGRSTRSGEDWSVTYVLDNSFYTYIYKHRKWFQPSFLKRIIWRESEFNLENFKNKGDQ